MHTFCFKIYIGECTGLVRNTRMESTIEFTKFVELPGFSSITGLIEGSIASVVRNFSEYCFFLHFSSLN